MTPHHVRTSLRQFVETFAREEHATPLQPQHATALTDALARWLELLRCLRAEDRLAVWLPEVVEDEVDRAWSASPQMGFLLDRLAVRVVMRRAAAESAAGAERECAPLPPPHTAADADLAAGGLPRSLQGAPIRRYAVLTWTHDTGCDDCMLSRECPKPKRQTISNTRSAS